MLMFNSETRYWQEQYKQGKIPEEWLDDMSGETLALLDGRAEKIGLYVCLFGVLFLFLLFWLVAL